MKKYFELNLPRSYQDSFKIINDSGQEVSGWSLVGADVETGFIEWKQIFWSGYGFAKIIAKLTETDDQNTLATISVYRPIQVWDPAKICDKVFKKLEREVMKKIN